MGLKDIYKKARISDISIDFHPNYFDEPFFAFRFFSGMALGFYPFTIIIWRNLK